jgi:predicted RNA-binding protein with PUA-like domain
LSAVRGPLSEWVRGIRGSAVQRFRGLAPAGARTPYPSRSSSLLYSRSSLPLCYHEAMARHWLMKSEPGVYSIDDLRRDGKTHWDGIRNYQARNNMREMKVGDRVLFYHSNADPPGVAGLARVVREAYPDFTAWDPDSRYHDPKSSRAEPRWYMVDVEFDEKLPRLVTLEEIKAKDSLGEMVLVKRSRLSVQSVRPREFEAVIALARSGSDR